METTLEERRVVALERIAFELKRANDATQEENDRLISCSEAASICGVTRQTVSLWIKSGRLKKTYRNGRMGILFSDLPLIKKPS